MTFFVYSLMLSHATSLCGDLLLDIHVGIIGHGLSSQAFDKVVQTNKANRSNTQHKKPKQLNLVKPNYPSFRLPFMPSSEEMDLTYSITAPGLARETQQERTGKTEQKVQRPALSVLCISVHSAAFSLVMLERWSFNSFWLVKLERSEFNSAFDTGPAVVGLDLVTLCTRQSLRYIQYLTFASVIDYNNNANTCYNILTCHKLQHTHIIHTGKICWVAGYVLQ